MPTTHLPFTPAPQEPTPSPLPPLLRTPQGLALLEIQGHLNLPPTEDASTPIGRLEFPGLQDGDGDANADGKADGSAPGAWQKHVFLYVGATQRLVGEVRALKRAVGVLRRTSEGVEVIEVVRFKLVFGGRPEFI